MDNAKRIELEQCFIIANRKSKDVLIELLLKKEARIIQTIYAKGSATAGTINKVFGFVPENNKVILISLLTSKNAKELIDTLDTEYNFNKPNTGIAYTVSVEGLSF